MTKPRNTGRHAKVHHPINYRGFAGSRDDTGAGSSGRTTYREEYERDRGPDQDEPVDRTESGDEY